MVAHLRGTLRPLLPAYNAEASAQISEATPCGQCLATALDFTTLSLELRGVVARPFVASALATVQPELCGAVRKAVAPAPRPQCSDVALLPFVESVLLPHRGVAFLDDDAGGRQWLANTVTHEHVQLPPTRRWVMDYDEDGSGIIIPIGCHGEPLLAEDLLNMAVWRTDVGRLYIVAESGVMKGSHVDLAAMEAKHVESAIHLKMGPASTKVSLQAWFL